MAAETARQTATALASAVQSAGATEVKEGSAAAEEPPIDEVTTGAFIEVIDEEMSLVADEAIKDLPAPADTAVIGPDESLPVTTETVIEIAPVTKLPTQIDEAIPSRTEVPTADVPLPQADEARSSRTVAFLVAETISEGL